MPLLLESDKLAKKKKEKHLKTTIESCLKVGSELKVLIPSKCYSKNKSTQTVCVNQQTVSIQCEPSYENKCAQTNT